MRAATLFSGIGAPEAARPDWDWLWHAEIEPFPAAVLAAHHPRSVNLGDVTAHDFAERALAIGRPDVLVFGSPCQSFSVAGKRLGLDDPRGNLALVALAVVRRVRPRWLVFENVPGLLSSGGGDDFAAFLAAVQECGHLGCWRVLDARHWGLAQRRQRVFFVGCLGDWRGPAEVLALAEGLRGYPEAGGEAREAVARPLGAGPPGGGGCRDDADTAENLIAADVANPLLVPSHGAAWRGGGSDNLIATTLRARDSAKGVDSDCTDTLIPVAYGGNDTRGPIEVATALNAHGGPHGRLDFESETFVAHAFDARQSDVCQCGDLVAPLDTDGHTMAVWQGGSQQDQVCSPDGVVPTLAHSSNSHGGHYQPKVMGSAIRRLTPTECERLQGFPDGWTAIEFRGKPVADGPRYRALGNAMAVPVVRWLLTRIEAQMAATVAGEKAA